MSFYYTERDSGTPKVYNPGMTRYDVKFTVWGNQVEVTIYAGSEAEAMETIGRRYSFFDDGSLSLTEEKEDDRQSPIVDEPRFS